MNQRLTPDNFLDGETVMMNFPKTVKLQLDDGAGTVTFFPGVQPVPVELSRHWWLRHNGVTFYDQKARKSAVADPAKENQIQKMTERELMYLQSRGYQVTGLQDAQLYFDNMEPVARPGFLQSVDTWWKEKIKADSEVQENEAPVQKKGKK
jgi:hypothetical protein